MALRKSVKDLLFEHAESGILTPLADVDMAIDPKTRSSYVTCQNTVLLFVFDICMDVCLTVGLEACTYLGILTYALLHTYVGLDSIR